MFHKSVSQKCFTNVCFYDFSSRLFLSITCVHTHSRCNIMQCSILFANIPRESPATSLTRQCCEVWHLVHYRCCWSVMQRTHPWSMPCLLAYRACTAVTHATPKHGPTDRVRLRRCTRINIASATAAATTAIGTTIATCWMMMSMTAHSMHSMIDGCDIQTIIVMYVCLYSGDSKVASSGAAFTQITCQQHTHNNNSDIIIAVRGCRCR